MNFFSSVYQIFHVNKHLLKEINISNTRKRVNLTSIYVTPLYARVESKVIEDAKYK